MGIKLIKNYFTIPNHSVCLFGGVSSSLRRALAKSNSAPVREIQRARSCENLTTKMAGVPVVLFLLLVCLLLIEGHISVPKVKGPEPTVIEIPSGGLPLSLVRNKRQQFSNVSHIGVTARLDNDSHNVAVVHWSGYPSEVSRSVL